ncbi:MAG: efflux RND transporter periplasmic adaptor subunit [Chthoniobacteraceae bacterium]
MKRQTDYLDGSADARQASVVLEPSPRSETPKHGPALHDGPPPSAPRLSGLVIAAIILAVGAFALGYFPRSRERAVVKRETSELALLTVDATSPAPAKAADPLIFSGEVKALSEAAIYARANGYVRRWLVDIGAHVEKDQLLAELDTPEVERDLAQGRAELAQADAARALAETTAKRWTEMLAAKTISRQETDEKVADLALKKATVEAGRAKVQRLEEMLGFNKITAPFAGTVTMRTLDVGQLVNAGAGRELFRIAQADKLRVFVRVPQNYARAMKTGQIADLTLTEIAGRTFEAKVVRTAGTLDAASRTLLTELEVDNAKGELFAGSYAQVRFRDVQPAAVLTIPANALLFRVEGAMVGVIGEGNRVTMKKVGLGRDFGSYVEVLDGLTAADRVIVNPPDALVEGAEVRAVKMAADAK